MKAAFQGVHGAYSEVATRRLLGTSCRTIPMETFEQVFLAVKRGNVDRGVIPIENSLAGSIHQNYDLLLRHQLHIVGETQLRIEHSLVCHPATNLRKLTSVRSHPQALAQCAAFFSRHRSLKPVAYFDTAGAARSIMEERATEVGALAGTYAARLYRLKILKSNVEDRANNFTRFFVISRTPLQPKPGVRTKCSIVFIPARNQVGILFRVLGVFALRDINLLKVESRPNPASTFDYMFYLDFQGHPHDPKVANALDHLQEMVTNFRLLGSYPEHTSISARKK